MSDCATLKAKLDAAEAVYDRLLQPGVRVVQDSDGSRIEYSLGNVALYRDKVALLRAQYDACTRPGAGRPFHFIF